MDPNFHPMFSGDTSDPLFSNFSLQSLLTYNNNPSFFSHDNTPSLPNLPETITHQTHPNLNNNENLFLVPKPEHPLNHLDLPPLEQFLPIQQPFNFFPQYLPPPPPPPFESFNRLPQLISHHEQPSTRKRPHHSETTTTSLPPSFRGKSPSSLIPQSQLARQRRQKLSEKTRCLQKLMPWDKKMDQATLLEEAFKYVKFLKAQHSVLQSMPPYSTTNYGGGNTGTGAGGVFGDLEMLNRNQALQVLVNSPVAQTKLCSQGYCVFSMEQFSLLRKLSERRQLQQQQQKNFLSFSDHGSSKTFFH
ncbi:hypothetical protein TSUD_105610 [Trifolium subterraneum]|uniref:BHLH domain-containing protein n=1 Tax=Trifolium subterraneum TaxID=3900 RepID=A0A2Z6LME0_TRISU|nr:hypothetical protein TSUD_105610 [Trifolium subterraneum]